MASSPHVRSEEAIAAQTASAVRSAAGDGGWRWWVGTAAAVFLGALYLVAVYAKVLDPQALADQITLEGLDVLLPATVVATLALALESALGVALLLNLRRLWVLVPTALLTVFFLALNLRAWWLAAHGLREDAAGCGCFGNLMDRTPSEALIQDLVLLGVPTLLVFVGRPRGGRTVPPLRTTLVVLAAVAVSVFAWKAPELPLDDLATRLRPGSTLSGMCAGRGGQRVCLDLLVPELARGEHLVVLADLGDDVLHRRRRAAERLRHGGAQLRRRAAVGAGRRHAGGAPDVFLAVRSGVRGAGGAGGAVGAASSAAAALLPPGRRRGDRDVVRSAAAGGAGTAAVSAGEHDGPKVRTGSSETETILGGTA